MFLIVLTQCCVNCVILILTFFSVTHAIMNIMYLAVLWIEGTKNLLLSGGQFLFIAK